MPDTVTIIPNQDFKHGTETFKTGESYELPEELAYYFERAGWVGGESRRGEDATLEIQDIQVGHTAEV